MAKLYFYYAAMNAGKSSTLLQASYNYIERGMDTLIFGPIIDARFDSAKKVCSRIGLSADAIAYDDAFDFYRYAEDAINKNPNIRCIFVDEAHFLKKAQVKQLSDITIKLNRPVLAYGLRADFRGEPFESSKYLLCWAEELIEIKTICHCGKKATMTLRLDEKGNPVTEGSVIEVGGNDRYVSVCRRHHLIGQLDNQNKSEE